MNSVELIGTYGGDLQHALAAWTSTSRDLPEEKRNRVPQLLFKLATEGHHTCFERSSLHFLVSCDTATHIQLLKHRIGVSINAESARYKTLKEPKSHVPADWPEECQDVLRAHTKAGVRLYHQTKEKLLQAGLSNQRAKESARYFLGYNNVITMDVMFNFRSFMHFLGLRKKSNAQKEIFDIAVDMLILVQDQGDFEHSLKAFGY